MINWIRDLNFEFQVWSLRCKRDWAWRSFNRKWKKEKKLYPDYDRHEFYDVNKYEIQIIDEQLEYLVSNHWIDVADRWNIPVPSVDEINWEQNQWYKWILNRHGVSSIRKIYFELKMNAQSMIIPWLTFWLALVGAGGTLWQVFHTSY